MTPSNPLPRDVFRRCDGTTVTVLRRWRVPGPQEMDAGGEWRETWVESVSYVESDRPGCSVPCSIESWRESVAPSLTVVHDGGSTTKER